MKKGFTLVEIMIAGNLRASIAIGVPGFYKPEIKAA